MLAFNVRHIWRKDCDVRQVPITDNTMLRACALLTHLSALLCQRQLRSPVAVMLTIALAISSVTGSSLFFLTAKSINAAS